MIIKVNTQQENSCCTLKDKNLKYSKTRNQSNYFTKILFLQISLSTEKDSLYDPSLIKGHSV